MSICSSNPQDHGGNTHSSWQESDLQVRKCHAMLFFESLYEPKTDRLDHRCRRKFHTSPISQPIFLGNPTSQCSNPIPTSRVWKKSQYYTYHLFSPCICKITASKCDPTRTQKFTRIYKDVLKITRSFQTVIKLSSSEFIAISPCHLTFLPFLPAGNLPSNL